MDEQVASACSKMLLTDYHPPEMLQKCSISLIVIPQKCDTRYETVCSTQQEEECGVVNERVCQLVEDQECTLVNEEQCNVVEETECTIVNEEKCATVDKNECQIVTDTVEIKFQHFECFNPIIIFRSVTHRMSKSATLCKRRFARQWTMFNAPLLKRGNALSSTSASVRLSMTPREYCNKSKMMIFELRPRTEEVCEQVVENICRAAPRQACTTVQEQECSTEYEQQCASVPQETCTTVYETVCETSGKTDNIVDKVRVVRFCLTLLSSPDHETAQP